VGVTVTGMATVHVRLATFGQTENEVQVRGGLSLSLSEADARAHGVKSEFLVARSRVLRRLGLNALSALEPAEPIRRYERENSGELIHLDIKKLGWIGSVGRDVAIRRNRKCGGTPPLPARSTRCALAPNRLRSDRPRGQQFRCP
jgi:hypothetical protein